LRVEPVEHQPGNPRARLAIAERQAWPGHRRPDCGIAQPRDKRDDAVPVGPYEPPESPELRIDTTAMSAEQAADAVIAMLEKR
jgi:hypothetical protein